MHIKEQVHQLHMLLPSQVIISFNGVYLNHSCFNKACTNSSVCNITVTMFSIKIYNLNSFFL